MAKKSKKAVKKPAAKKAVAKKATPKAAKKIAKRAAPKKAAATSAPVKKGVAKPRGSALVGVAPGFTANDAAATIKWYCDVLGFKVVERWEHEGKFLGAQIGRGSVLINIGQDDWKLGRDRVKGQGTRSYIMMGPDVDGYANTIKVNGGVLTDEPRDGWGVRAFSIDDPDGFKLTFMSPLKG